MTGQLELPNDEPQDMDGLIKKARLEHATPATFSFWDLSDEGLLRVRRDYLRMLFNGTSSFDRYYRFDDAPNYLLARDMDFKRWEIGARHIIDWARFVEKEAG